jgi:arsenite methyltransferase
MASRNQILNIVKNAYSRIAQSKDECVCEKGQCETNSEIVAQKVGYNSAELAIIPEDANLGLSCGNPTALASLKPDDIVLDIGSGAGFDCFLAAHSVTKGKIIGVDASGEMVAKSKSIAKKRGVLNTEFRTGQMENLPVETASVDVVMSNCAINLTPYKRETYKEIYRVLKPQGRIAVSDVCLKKELPDDLKPLLGMQPCLQANLLISEYEKLLEESNFKNIKLSFKEIGNCITELSNDPFGKEIAATFKNKYNVVDYIVSIQITATK